MSVNTETIFADTYEAIENAADYGTIRDAFSGEITTAISGEYQTALPILEQLKTIEDSISEIIASTHGLKLAAASATGYTGINTIDHYVPRNLLHMVDDIILNINKYLTAAGADQDPAQEGEA